MIELFAVLKASRLPESLIELSMLIYRYIFVFLDMALSIRYAQTVRLGYSNFRRSIHSLGMLASTLFVRSWEQGDKLFLAMNSRCYDGKMTLFEVHRPVRAAELLLTSAYFLSALALFYFTKKTYPLFEEQIMIILETRSLKYTYPDGTAAVQDINIEIKKKEKKSPL